MFFWRYFWSEGVDSGSASGSGCENIVIVYMHRMRPNINNRSLLRRVLVYDLAGFKEYCKDFAVTLKIIAVFNKKQILYTTV